MSDGDGFNGGSDSYLQFRDTHVPCLLKLCIPPSSGIVRWWLFPEFGAELPLDNFTPTVILNNPVFIVIAMLIVRFCYCYCYVRYQRYTMLTNILFPTREIIKIISIFVIFQVRNESYY